MNPQEDSLLGVVIATTNGVILITATTKPLVGLLIVQFLLTNSFLRAPVL